MEIFGHEKLSLVDYDGVIATTIFTGSCNFCCQFCHNGPLVNAYKNLPIIDENEIFNYLIKRKGIIEGVCISGGEPTLQKDLPKFAEKIKKLGFKVKLDTNGTNPEMIKLLDKEKLVDYFAMDIKNNKQDYKSIIGNVNFDIKLIENSVSYLLTKNDGYEFRTTLIKEYHKNENIKKIAEWIKGAKTYCFQKFVLRDTCISLNLHEVGIEQAKEFLKIVSPFVKNAFLRGY